MAKRRSRPAAEAPELPADLRVRNRGVQEIPVADIVDNPLNFRTHDTIQREAFEATVAEIGWYGYPDVFELPDQPGKFMLIDGQLRSEHLRERYGPDARIPVNVTDFALDEARKALATKDPLAGMAQVDRQQLGEILRGIETDSAKFQELIELLAQQERVDLEPLPDGIWDETELPEPSDELVARHKVEPGALFVIAGNARHRLLCGDPAEPEHVRQLLGDSQPLLLVTHPRAAIPQAAFELFWGPVAYVWYAVGRAGEAVRVLQAAKFKIRAQLIWRSEDPADEAPGHYRHDHDPCLYAVRDGRSALWNGARDQSTIADANYPRGLGAPPLEFAGRAIHNHGSVDHAVFDPCTQQGSTIVAADRIRRPALGIEPDPYELAVTLERLARSGATWERYT